MSHTRRSLSWERRPKGIVYDRQSNSIQVRREADVKKERGKWVPSVGERNDFELKIFLARYVSCELPSRQKTVSVFLNNDESVAYVKNCSRRNSRRNSGMEEEVFIGVLDLDMLPIKDKISRFCGNLKTLYVEKSHIDQSYRDFL
jgi:hypothetical protein